MPLREYIQKGGRSLRLGYTTGSCAAMAAGAATALLLGGRPVAKYSLATPGGIEVTADILEPEATADSAACAVRKDAGDDPDITDGILVRATVRKTPGPGVTVDGGCGVGRVTRPGLEQPVGAAAINSVPRRMIEREVRRSCDANGYAGGIAVVISIPDGAELAARTFNPCLGIVGGLSVIGTSGIVEPMSSKAVVDTIEAELSVHHAEGRRYVVVTPGNYGENFLRDQPRLAGRPTVKCSNFIGETLDLAAGLGFAGALLVGHVGKLVKLSGGVMDTHSRVADCRTELLALQAALVGADVPLLGEVLDAVTVDDGIAALERHGLREAVMRGVLGRMEHYLLRRAGGRLAVGALVFSNRHGYLGATPGAESLMERMEKEDG